MQLTVDSNQYSFLLNGTVYPYTLQSGDILWEGMLEGTSIINNNDCILLASFIRLNDDIDVQVSLTIHVLNEEPDQSIIAFSFGSNILTNQIYNELQSSITISHDHGSTASNINTIASTSSNGFIEIDSYPVYWQSGNSYKLSHTHNVYFSPLTNELAISIGTYCSNINSIYDDDNNISVTYVSSFEIRLKSPNTSNPNTIANIGGINAFEFELVDNSSVYSTLSDLFSDAFNYIGKPVSQTILNAIFGTLENAAKGTVTSSDNYKNSYVRVSFGLGDNHNFDDLTNGLPIVFLLEKNEPVYTGNSILTSHTSIIYRTSVMDANTLQSQIYYTTSPSTSRTHTITLQ